MNLSPKSQVEQLEELTWTLYTSPGSCHFCDLAESLLVDKGVAFRKVPASKTLLATVAEGQQTYPQLVDNRGNHVGGFLKARDRLDEPLLDTEQSRFSPIPVVHTDIWRMYKEAQAVNWVAEEIDYSIDLQQWSELSRDEQHFLKHVLAFFNGADGIVQENLMMNFVLEVQYPEARQFYVHQAYVESVHAETYGLLLNTYVTDEAERARLVSAILTTPSVHAKAMWARKWMDTSRCFAERLIAFICVEGIMFSASFCAIFWMKKRGILQALTLSNDFIARDEGMHQQFGVLLYNDHLKHRLGQGTVHQIVREAVDSEIQFVEDAIPTTLRDPHINAERMVEYVKYIADRILTTLGYEVAYGAQQPFDWMESISLRGLNNFFEKRSEMYRDARVGQISDEPMFDMEDIEF